MEIENVCGTTRRWWQIPAEEAGLVNQSVRWREARRDGPLRTEQDVGESLASYPRWVIFVAICQNDRGKVTARCTDREKAEKIHGNEPQTSIAVVTSEERRRRKDRSRWRCRRGAVEPMDRICRSTPT
jgi:hypothetical protein